LEWHAKIAWQGDNCRIHNVKSSATFKGGKWEDEDPELAKPTDSHRLDFGGDFKTHKYIAMDMEEMHGFPLQISRYPAGFHPVIELLLGRPTSHYVCSLDTTQ
jgi:hypothetical protein